VNADGQLIFDVGAGSSLASNVAGGLEDDEWHYIVASYLPNYVNYTAANGTTFQLPSNVGTAKLYIDNHQASQSTVINAYQPSNVNDELLLLANNAGAAIDQLALYDTALTALTLPPATANWPVPNNEEALLALRELGLVIDTKTPAAGAIPGAVTSHWDGRNVNPNNAVLNTFYSFFTPAANGSQSGSWSEASSLNPILAATPTTPSAAQPDAGQNALVLSISPSLWGTNSWAVTPGSTASTQTGKTFNPSGLELDSVKLLINGASDPVTLKPDQILIGNATLASLQPNSSSSQLNYTILSDAPALTFVPPLDRTSAAAVSSAATTATLVFSNGTSTQIALTPSLVSDATTQPLASAVRVATINGHPLLTSVETSNKALGTSAILEQAPLQLKYINSGEVFRSTTSATTANQTAASTPAQSFGYSQVSGAFVNSSGGTSSGWLAIAQPYTTKASSDPSGRIWIQYTGQFTVKTTANGEIRTAVSDVAQAPNTWLNALAGSNFSPETPNLPLLHSAVSQSSSGGLLIQADPTVGLDQNFGFTMLTARVNSDTIDDLIIAAPQANGGGRVYIIDGTWIANNLSSANGATILNLANPDDLGDVVKVLTPGIQTDAAGKPRSSDEVTVAGFGTALAYDDLSNTLWIGAPNYLRNLGDPATIDGLKPIGALYSYSLPSNSSDWGAATAVKLAPIVGIGGTLTSAGPVGTPVTSYWGAQFGSALAVSDGRLAVSAPGMVAGTLASGTEAAVQTFQYGKKVDTSNSGIISGLQLPDLITGAIDISKGTNSHFAVIGSSKTPTATEQAYLNQTRNLVSDSVTNPTIYNNQAVQADAAGAVFYLSSSGDLLAAPSLQTFADKGSVYYGPNTLNTLGATGFGSSVAFIDLTNVNTPSLAIGADASGGAGAVYLIDPKASANNLPVTGLQSYQKLAANEAYLTLTGAESRDLFGNGLVNLGDVNQDTIDDLLIQAKNAGGAAGIGYVLFGSDQFSSSSGKSVTGTVAPGSITQFTRADGSSFVQSILVQQGYGSGFTGAGSFGRGDINADGINDIQLGSGPNGNAYLTWGHPYLEAIGNLALSKLASDTGYLLDGLASTNEGSLRAVGDFNGDGYGDFISIQPGGSLTTVRIELGADTETVLADYLYNFYTFSVLNGTQVIAAGDVNGDGYADIALFSNQNLSSTDQGNQGAGSTTGILYGRSSTNLPIGSGFGLLAPLDPTTGAPLTALPGLLVAGSKQLKGFTSATPALIADGNTLYTAVKGATDNTIWFNTSSNGGASWDNWTNLSAVYAAFNAADGAGPSLALHNGRLFLSFLNRKGKLLISSWNPTSNDNSDWTQPALLNSAAAALADSSDIPFSSAYGPQLIDRGDALGILWVDQASGTLYAAASTDPKASEALGWVGEIGGSTSTTPALAQIGSTIYMAVQDNGPGNNAIYWNSSSDGGSTWAGWQALDDSLGFQTSNAPSLAVYNGELYLSCVASSSSQIKIAKLDRSTKNWSSAGIVGSEQAQKYASLISETVGGVEQLAVYFVANNATSTLLKSHTTSSGLALNWSANQTIDYNNGNNLQTASGPIALATINGSTVMAYQGGTIASPSNIINLASSSIPNSSPSWSAQSFINPNQRTTPSLTASPEGLILGYSASNSSKLQLALLANASGTWQALNAYSIANVSGQINDVGLLTIASSSSDNTLLLAGVNTASGNGIETNLLSESVDHSWTPPSQLLERIEINGEVSFSGIAASAAPAATWLGDVPIVAVNNTVNATSSINVYSVGGSTQSWTLASSFSASGDQPAISAKAPGLTTTDSGIALSYTNSDRSITVNQLAILNPNGTPVDGLQFNADGTLTPSPGQTPDLQWSGTTFTAANSGISSDLSSTPVSVNGTLLLANVRPAATPEGTQLWLNTLPAAKDPDSTTWLNTTLQLSDGNGGWLVQQQGGASHPVALGVLDPGWQQPNGGLSPWAPSIAAVDGVLYAAVRGWSGSNDTNKTLYWNRSFDNGVSWSSWQQLPNGMTSDRPPTIAAFDGTLYLVYIGQDNAHTLNLTKLDNADTNHWADQIQIRAGASGASNQTAEFATLVNEVVDKGNQLALYYVGTGKNELYSTSSTDPYTISSFSNSTLIKYNNNSGTQTASGPLAAARLNNTTYLAYQGGTYVGTKSNAIFLTTGSANNTNWNLINGIPQPGSASHTGVGLAANSTGLVLSYSDVVDTLPVVSLQQGTGSGSSWSFSPYSVLERPADGQALYDGANSLFSQTSSEAVLVSTIDPSANEAIVTAWVTPLPPSLALTAAQTRSTLTPVGDITGDGLADLLITATNVVRSGSGGSAPQLQTGVRLLSGAATSEGLLAANNATATNQTLQLAPAFSFNSGAASTSLTASGGLGGLPSSRSAAETATSSPRSPATRAWPTLAPPLTIRPRCNSCSRTPTNASRPSTRARAGGNRR
jgi:FG-GAP repeat